MDLYGWLHDPLVWPIYVIVVLGAALALLTALKAWRQGTFDPTLLPKFLADYWLDQAVPLGLAAFVVWALRPAPGGQDLLGDVLTVAYGAGVLAVIAKDAAKLAALLPGQDDPAATLDMGSEIDGLPPGYTHDLPHPGP